MKVKFLQYFQGVEVDPYSYHPGDEAELDNALAKRLIANGQAVAVQIAPKKTAAKGADDAKK